MVFHTKQIIIFLQKLLPIPYKKKSKTRHVSINNSCGYAQFSENLNWCNMNKNKISNKSCNKNQT